MVEGYSRMTHVNISGRFTDINMWTMVPIGTNLNAALWYTLTYSSVYQTAGFFNYAFHTWIFPNLLALCFLLFHHCINYILSTSQNAQYILIPVSSHDLCLKHAAYKMKYVIGWLHTAKVTKINTIYTQKWEKLLQKWLQLITTKQNMKTKNNISDSLRVRSYLVGCSVI